MRGGCDNDIGVGGAKSKMKSFELHSSVDLDRPHDEHENNV